MIPTISGDVPSKVNAAATTSYVELAMIIYCLTAAALTLRFTVNLFRIMRTAWKNPRTITPEGTVVLINEKLAPHSFLFFTFLNQDDYLNQKIEQEIITHEFAHVRQKHSVDLLLVEVLMVIFWFNPIFLLYKKAIQLNHEFLADEAVIESSSNISAYQRLLLQKATLRTVNLASNFNFSVTKKRFKMMKKETSKRWRVIKAISLIPLAAILLLVFNKNAYAQAESANPELRITTGNSGQISRDEYYKGAYMRYINNAGVTVRKKYEELTADEKSYYPDPVQPTDALMLQWKDEKRYVVRIGYGEPTEPLANYKAKDFVSYYSLKSQTDERTYIVLIKRDFLEKIKALGGDFNKVGIEVALAPPPPIVIPAKNN